MLGRSTHGPLGAALIAVTVAVAGCASSSTQRAEPTPSAGAPTATQTPPGGSDAVTPPPQVTSTDRTPRPPVAGVKRVSEVKAAVLPLGRIESDGFALPLLSPDGRFVVSQTGVAPEWATTLAEIDAPVAQATSISIHELVLEQRSIRSRGELEQGLLLGRQSSNEGFLVEQPRTDGSRWIGHASWTDRQIQWLVADDNANAFATTGPSGQLAWSRRLVGAERFELVVRDASGDAWTLGDANQDWLMPTWSGTGDGLFALLLEDGRLDLVHMLATDQTAARQSLRRLPLSTNGSVYVAYQIMNGQPLVLDETPAREQIVFYHPRQHRAAVWRPHAVERALVLLGRRTMTAVIDPAGYALAPTDGDLFLVEVDEPGEPAPLLKGLLIPRATPASPYPYVLLTPFEREIGLTAMQLLE